MRSFAGEDAARCRTRPPARTVRTAVRPHAPVAPRPPPPRRPRSPRARRPMLRSYRALARRRCACPTQRPEGQRSPRPCRAPRGRRRCHPASFEPRSRSPHGDPRRSLRPVPRTPQRGGPRARSAGPRSRRCIRACRRRRTTRTRGRWRYRKRRRRIRWPVAVLHGHAPATPLQCRPPARAKAPAAGPRLAGNVSQPFGLGRRPYRPIGVAPSAAPGRRSRSRRAHRSGAGRGGRRSRSRRCGPSRRP